MTREIEASPQWSDLEKPVKQAEAENMGRSKGMHVDVRQAEDGKCYVRNDAAVLEIIRKVESGHWAMVLGPRHNQKTLLLKDVKAELSEHGDWACILVDLLDLREVAESDFLNKFATTFERQRKSEKIKIENPPASSTVTAEPSSLQGFLEEHMRKIPRLVLLIDHLERIQIEPLEFLLSAFMALHKTQSNRASHKLRVVAASSSNLELRSGRTSFMDIAHAIWIRDMSLSESRELIRFILRQKTTRITSNGERRLCDATKGDRYLLPILSEHCAALVGKDGRQEVGEQDANKAVDWFVNEWAKGFPPLRGNVRAVARDTIALMNVLKVLGAGKVAERELMLDHKVDAYELRLTGVITIKENNGEKYYLIKNEFYERYLKDNFRPEHVPHILSMAGGWENAINYLHRLIVDFPQYRPAILDKMLDFIHRAEDESVACDYLIRQASRVFGLAKAKVYIVKPVRSHLEQRGQIGFDGKQADELPLETDPLKKDMPEVTAYKTQDFVVSPNNTNEHKILVPLLRNDGGSLGVAVVYDFKGDIHGENFLELLAYFKRAGRAVGSVIDRARESLQLSTLNEMGQQVTSSLDKQKVMQATVDAAIKSVPGAQRGVLFLWNENRERLVIEAVARRELFKQDVAKDIILGKGEGYAGRVFATGEILSIGNVREYPSVKHKDHPDIKDQKSVLCVPLKVWGRMIGVLCVDNIAAVDAFEDNDTRLLSTFAAQAAIALQNAQLFTELHELGLSINSGTLKIEDIFIQTVQSITRMSGAVGAHLLLLRDIDDETVSTADKVVDSKSVGLGRDYDDKVRPRPDGLTFLVLRDRKVHAVRNIDERPGINKLAYERGTRAYICLPMEVQETVIGVLFVYYGEERSFTQDEIEMLSLFANLAALAIENTRQREQLGTMEAVAWMGIEFSDMEHSIRQELASMKIAIDLLRSKIMKSAQAFGLLDKLQKYVTDTDTILGRAPLHIRITPTRVELNEMLRTEVKNWCPKEEGIKTDFEQLSKEKIVIEADYHLLATVLKILTTNAVRAVKSSANKKVTVSSTTRKGKAIVTMTNTGKEIPPDIRAKLFEEPISKAPGALGSGVGLLIAWSILFRSGGEIKLVKSDPKETTFSFSLPLITSRTEADTTEKEIKND